MNQPNKNLLKAIYSYTNLQHQANIFSGRERVYVCECAFEWECVCHLRAQSFAKILIEWQRIEKVCDATKIDYTHATLKSCNSSSSCNSSRARIEILRACWGHKHGNVSRKGGRAGQGGVGMGWCGATSQPGSPQHLCQMHAACCRFASLLQFILIACQAAKRKRERREEERKREKTAAGNSRQHSPGATMRVTRRLQHVKSTVNQVSTRSGQRLCAAALPIEWRQSICSAP